MIFKTISDLLRHLNTHEICHGYYSSSELKEMEQFVTVTHKEKSSIDTEQQSVEDPELFMMDVYADGCKFKQYPYHRRLMHCQLCPGYHQSSR